MMGILTFTWGRATVVARLEDDRTWTVPLMPALSEALALLGSTVDVGPADGDPAEAILTAARSVFGGTYQLSPRRQHPADTTF